MKLVNFLPKLDLRARRVLGQFSVGMLFVAMLMGHAGGLYEITLINKIDALIYDKKVQATGIRELDERVAIIDIDDKSLKALGRWPWPRELTARLTTTLFEQYSVAAVGYDIVFSEPDQSSGLPVLERLAKGRLANNPDFASTLNTLRPELDYDEKFARSLGGGVTVLGFYFSESDSPEITGVLPPTVVDCAELKKYGVQPQRVTGHVANLPALQGAATSAGNFNMTADFDGVARRMPLVTEFQGKCYGSLSLMTTRAVMGVEKVGVLPAAGLHPATLDIDGLQVPLDVDARALIPFRPPGAFEYISVLDVLEGRTPVSKLEGRVVLIGSTAPGILDLRVSPFTKSFPGVEIHANLISGILDGLVKWEPVGVHKISTLMVLAIGLLLGVVLAMLTPVKAALLTVVISLALFLFDFYAWSALHAQVPIASALLAAVGLFVINMSYGFFVEAKSKAQMTKLFGQYVPRELVGEMARDPARYNLRGESRVMSVLFSDIRDFTSISETLEASQLAEMLNLYLSHMTGIVQHQKGTIDKYIGDAIMAFWGAPMSDEFHARDSVIAALAMQTSLEQLNPVLESHGYPAVKIGVGVNTGRMSVGNMGSEFRMAYTVMADAVNLASRLEGLTKQYGVGVLAGDETRAACPDIAFVPVDRVRVKGKLEPVAIFEPLGMTESVPEARLKEKQEFEAALADYLAKKWDSAEKRLKTLYAATERTLYAVYIDRIAHFRENPPPADWDGVFTFTTK